MWKNVYLRSAIKKGVFSFVLFSLIRISELALEGTHTRKIANLFAFSLT